MFDNNICKSVTFQYGSVHMLVACCVGRTNDCDWKISCIRNFSHGKQTENHKLNKKRYRAGLYTAAYKAQRSPTCTHKLLLITLSTVHIHLVRAKFFFFLTRDVKSEEREEGKSNNGTKIKAPKIT
jgi:hypothetical protein